MSGPVLLSPEIEKIMKTGGVFVPSPLALDTNMQIIESYQRLLTLYYIKSGAKAVIPGAHTGEFALNDLRIFERWLIIVKEMISSYCKGMILMTVIGGENAKKEAKIAAKYGYDIVMLAPTAFLGLEEKGVIKLIEEIASIIPIIAFELQRAIPGSFNYTKEIWDKIFNIVYGVKGASFDTYRSLNMLEAVAGSPRHELIALFTGNDDRIVSDLLGEFAFKQGNRKIILHYHGGLLGHFATDTHAAVNWVKNILERRQTGKWSFELSIQELIHAVNRCNMALFDALNNFENSVWGVKYRLTKLGLLPAPTCLNEKGSPGLAQKIDMTYGEYPLLCDEKFLGENLDRMKNEVGM